MHKTDGLNSSSARLLLSVGYPCQMYCLHYSPSVTHVWSEEWFTSQCSCVSACSSLFGIGVLKLKGEPCLAHAYEVYLGVGHGPPLRIARNELHSHTSYAHGLLFPSFSGGTLWMRSP